MKTGNKTWSLFGNTSAKLVEKEFNVPRFSTHVPTCFVTNQIVASCWILTSDWIKLRGSHAIHRSYVTCLKTSLSWAGKTRNIHIQILLQKVVLLDRYFLQNFFTICNKLVCCKTGLIRGWRVTSLFNSFCSNLMLQNYRSCTFLLHVLPVCAWPSARCLLCVRSRVLFPDVTSNPFFFRLLSFNFLVALSNFNRP